METLWNMVFSGDDQGTVYMKVNNKAIFLCVMNYVVVFFVFSLSLSLYLCRNDKMMRHLYLIGEQVTYRTSHAGFGCFLGKLVAVF